MLIEKVLATLPLDPVPVRDIVSGLHWTAVASRYCGLASSLWSESPPETDHPDLSSLKICSAQELAQLALSNNHFESSIGMAAINSLLNPVPPGSVDLNAHDWLISQGRGKTIAMIGHFPFADDLKAVAKSLWILEKNPLPGDFPASESNKLIPQAEILAITGSAFVNHSIDEVLAFRNPESLVIVLGPSTPLAPVLFDSGISILSGTYAYDEKLVLDLIAQGSSYRNLKGVRRITVIRKPEVDK